jgi:hypothetical protein
LQFTLTLNNGAARNRSRNGCNNNVITTQRSKTLATSDFSDCQAGVIFWSVVKNAGFFVENLLFM